MGALSDLRIYVAVTSPYPWNRGRPRIRGIGALQQYLHSAFLLPSTTFSTKWFHTREVLVLILVIVLIGCCVSEIIVSYSADCVSCYAYVSVKREPEIMRVLMMLTLKVENMSNSEERRK